MISALLVGFFRLASEPVRTGVQSPCHDHAWTVDEVPLCLQALTPGCRLIRHRRLLAALGQPTEPTVVSPRTRRRPRRGSHSMTAVFFLDIDGVLNCRASYDRPRERRRMMSSGLRPIDTSVE